MKLTIKDIEKLDDSIKAFLAFVINDDSDLSFRLLRSELMKGSKLDNECNKVLDLVGLTTDVFQGVGTQMEFERLMKAYYPKFKGFSSSAPKFKVGDKVEFEGKKCKVIKVSPGEDGIPNGYIVRDADGEEYEPGEYNLKLVNFSTKESYVAELTKRLNELKKSLQDFKSGKMDLSKREFVEEYTTKKINDLEKEIKDYKNLKCKVGDTVTCMATIGGPYHKVRGVIEDLGPVSIRLESNIFGSITHVGEVILETIEKVDDKNFSSRIQGLLK